MKPNLLPQVIQDFIAAANKPDPKAYADCFQKMPLYSMKARSGQAKLLYQNGVPSITLLLT